MGNACSPIIRPLDHFGDGWEGAFFHIRYSYESDTHDDYYPVTGMKYFIDDLEGSTYQGFEIQLEIVSGKWESGEYVPCRVEDDADCPPLKRPWEMKFSVQPWLETWFLESEPRIFYGGADTKLVVQCVDGGLYSDSFYSSGAGDDADVENAKLVPNSEESSNYWMKSSVKPVHYRADFPPHNLCPLPVSLTLRDASGEGWYKGGREMYTQFFIDDGKDLVARGSLVDAKEDTVDIKLPSGSYTFRAGGYFDLTSIDHSWTVGHGHDISASGNVDEQLEFTLDSDCKMVLGDKIFRTEAFNYSIFDNKMPRSVSSAVGALKSSELLTEKIALLSGDGSTKTATTTITATTITATESTGSSNTVAVASVSAIVTALVMIVLFAVLGRRTRKKQEVQENYEVVMDESAAGLTSSVVELERIVSVPSRSTDFGIQL